jgi:hypothetical protein
MSALLRLAPGFFGRALRVLASPKGLVLCFLLCALPPGLGIALLAPIGMAPDEVPHIVRADALRLGQVNAMTQPGAFPKFHMNTSIFMVLNAREVYAALTGKPVPPELVAQAESIIWYQDTIDCPSQMAAYFPVFYVPGAVGLAAGKAAGLSPLHALYLGRVAMLLAYLALGGAALGLARWGGALIFAVLTLPPSLAIAASYNQDGPMLACAALAAALLTRTSGARKMAAGLGLIAVALAKLPYLPLLALTLMPLRAPGLPRRVLLLALATVAPLLWLAHISRGGFAPYTLPAYHPGPLWPGPHGGWLKAANFGENLLVLRAHPAIILWMPAASVVSAWSWIWPHFFCMTAYDHWLLGGGDWPLQAAALMMAMLGAVAARPGPAKEDMGLAALIVFGAFTAMEISMYLTFTGVGATRIDGVQARYFLPIMPFLIFCLPALGRLPGLVPLTRLPQGVFLLPALAVGLAHSYSLPAAIFYMFRIPGP